MLTTKYSILNETAKLPSTKFSSYTVCTESECATGGMVVYTREGFPAVVSRLAG